MTCPDCEYHKGRAQRWRDEAYKQAGHPLPEREWVGLTAKEVAEIVIYPMNKTADLVRAIEAKLKEINQ